MPRPKGSLNKSTLEIKQIIHEALSFHLDSINDYINALETPKDKIDAICKLLPYIAPKLREIEVTGIHHKQIDSIEVTIVN
jgi:hypothetical protein